MPASKPSPPRLSDPTEISVTCEWDPVDGARGYVILVKSIADDDQPWTAATRHACRFCGRAAAPVRVAEDGACVAQRMRHATQ